MEIVIDGLNEEAVREATRVGVLAACHTGAARITAGNYGGKLGRYHFYLHDWARARINSNEKWEIKSNIPKKLGGRIV